MEKISKLESLKELREKLNIVIEGKENIPKERGYIAISNHDCLKDIFYLPLCLPRSVISLISPRLIYKKDFRRQSAVNKYLYSMPVEAHGGSIYSSLCLNMAANLLCDGLDLNIFPEGAYIDNKNIVNRGRTGAARILYEARQKNVNVDIIPIAININQKNSDLDNFEFSSDDEVYLKILNPIDYNEYYYGYVNSSNIEEKNENLHKVIDEGMIKIAAALGRKYTNQYIELFPKGNVMFANGEKINIDDSRKMAYINRYEKELETRANKIKKILIK